MNCSIKARLTKAIYYNDETIILDIDVDNTESAKPLFSIEVTLRQSTLVKSKLDYNSKNNLEKHIDLA